MVSLPKPSSRDKSKKPKKNKKLLNKRNANFFFPTDKTSLQNVIFSSTRQCGADV